MSEQTTPEDSESAGAPPAQVVDLEACKTELEQLADKWMASGMDPVEVFWCWAAAGNGGLRSIGFSLQQYLETVSRHWIAAGGRP